MRPTGGIKTLLGALAGLGALIGPAAGGYGATLAA